MSLLRTYRSQIATRQQRQLLGYLALAVTIHAAGAVGVAAWQSQDWFNPRPQADPTPIEFVAIEPDPQSSQSPDLTERRAQTNSTAGSNPNPNLTVQAGKPQPKLQPKLRPKLQVQSQPKSPAAAQISPQPAPRRSVPSPAPTPSPLSPPPSPIISTSPTSPSSASNLGPINRSTSIEGASEPLNPNRAAVGSGVDATQDAIWGQYLTRLNRTIDQNWQRVSVAATRQTRIQFRVDRQGQLHDLQIIQSSGDTLADQAALDAIQAAAPFAPLPQNAAEEVLTVNFTFTQWLMPASP